MQEGEKTMLIKPVNSINISSNPINFEGKFWDKIRGNKNADVEDNETPSPTKSRLDKITADRFISNRAEEEENEQKTRTEEENRKQQRIKDRTDSTNNYANEAIDKEDKYIEEKLQECKTKNQSEEEVRRNYRQEKLNEIIKMVPDNITPYDTKEHGKFCSEFSEKADACRDINHKERLKLFVGIVKELQALDYKKPDDTFLHFISECIFQDPSLNNFVEKKLIKGSSLDYKTDIDEEGYLKTQVTMDYEPIIIIRDGDVLNKKY
jgi:hypothetical protein